MLWHSLFTIQIRILCRCILFTIRYLRFFPECISKGCTQIVDSLDWGKWGSVCGAWCLLHARAASATLCPFACQRGAAQFYRGICLLCRRCLWGLWRYYSCSSFPYRPCSTSRWPSLRDVCCHFHFSFSSFPCISLWACQLIYNSSLFNIRLYWQSWPWYFLTTHPSTYNVLLI